MGLSAGDTIGIVALSSAIAPDLLELGLSRLKAWGFKVRVGLDPTINYGHKQYLFSSADAAERVSVLEEFYSDPDIKLIINARGAYGSVDLLGLLDYAKLSAHPTPLVGFSDLTALLLSIYSRGGIGLVHGPALASFGNRDQAVAEHEFRALQRLINGTERLLLEGQVLSPVNSVVQFASGPLVGGNLAVMVSLLGTPWFPDINGHILFIEEVGEAPYRVHRMLTQLALAGVFDHCAAVLLGHFTGCIHRQGLGPTLDDVFKAIFLQTACPVYHCAAFGHTAPNLPLPIGLKAKIINNTLELCAPFVLS